MTDKPRTPPEKIRVTKLQEAQLHDLATMEAHCAAMFHEVGITQVQPRADADIALLARGHDVVVAEADHQVAGFLVWADQAPGVGWVPTLMVDPEFQRFGVATRLLRDLGETTKGLGIDYVVVPAWPKAPFSTAFLQHHEFASFAAEHPTKLDAWRELNPSLEAQGQTLWWAKTDGLGAVRGIPRPSEPPPSA